MSEHMKDVPTDRLSALWTAEHSPRQIGLEILRREALRRRRKMLLVTASEAVLTIVLIGLTLAYLLGEIPLTRDTISWLALLWISWAVATGFAFWNRRGVWATKNQSMLGHLALIEKRALRRRRAGRFVVGLTLVLTVACLSLDLASPPFLVMAGLYVAWALWYERKAGIDLGEARRDIAEFREEETPM